ncbi:thiamine monophosphate synthase [Methylocella silvestris BL2]|uniref:Thiamine monophosphate synthase n=1 Tax=Methylocella silvestris (strain DSM 15510 / CIP 108128 / LMG 27833 / NCIMB 13906 / BL2) TaxID=395965 RepID=B8EQM1_METSB|nr:thiamine phosphate synthase [Methylocella silvestris]ACK49292.1 thiamine monophosphate synthase [Methylocella silvestris BL2]
MPDDAPRLFLITPRISEADSFAPQLAAALSVCDVACVLLRTQTRDPGDAKKIIKILAPIAQQRDVAVLVEGDPQLAVRAGADGCHVEAGAEALQGALSSLKPDRIVGAGALQSRDEAMSAGETGVDYLMFGGPDHPQPHEFVLERVAWWAEIFNIPCVAYAQTLGEAADFAEAGADFIALADAVFADPRGPTAAVADVAAILATIREKAR